MYTNYSWPIGGVFGAWPPGPQYVLAGSQRPALYTGAYADRQSRFYLRSLRRDGVFFVDLPTVVLWQDNNGCLETNDLWP
jgi:hypothetical protein